MSLGTWFCMLRRNILPTSSMTLLTSWPWRWRHHIPLERQKPPTQQQRVTFLKTWILKKKRRWRSSDTQWHTFWYTMPHLLIHNTTPSDTQCHTFRYAMPHLPSRNATPSDTRYLHSELETCVFLCPSWQGWESPAPFKKSSDKIPH